MRILIINGPNMNLLGIREPKIYGTITYSDLISQIEDYAKKLSFSVNCFQSNHEGDLIDTIQNAYGCYDGIIINPAGYTHTSVAIADALRAVNIPTVEVHISDIDAREEFRKISLISPCAIAVIKGHGVKGYFEAIDLLLKKEN